MFMDDHHGDGRLALWCAAPAGVQEALVEAEPGRYFRPPYVGHRGWLGVRLDRAPDWAEIAERLRANPGRWLLIFEGQRASLATALYLDHISAVRRADGFEVRTANNTRDYPRTCDTYMRYNPQREA
jgi:hypothetical protein